MKNIFKELKYLLYHFYISLKSDLFYYFNIAYLLEVAGEK